jgi:hypothetical protein
VADRHGRVLLHEQERDRHANDRGTTDDQRVLAGDLDPDAILIAPMAAAAAADRAIELRVAAR